MWIEKIRIKGFGKLNKKDINLNNGLNIIYGDNESGKSTLLSFIKNMFFSPRKTGYTGFDNGKLIRSKPFENDEFGGSIEYFLKNNGKFRIERDFNNNEIKIFDSDYSNITGNFVITKEKGNLFAHDHLGLDFEVFKSSVLVEQSDLRIVKNSVKELIEKVVNVILTGNQLVSVEKALDCLKEELKINVGTNRTKKRPLDLVVNRLNEFNNMRNELLNKRNYDISIESKKYDLLKQKDEAIRDKVALTKIREIMNCYESIKIKEKMISSSKSLIKSIQSNIEELVQLKEKETKFSFLESSLFGNEDSASTENTVEKNYKILNEYKNKIDINSNIIEKENLNIIALEDEVEKYREFSKLEGNNERSVIEFLKNKSSIIESNTKGVFYNFLNRTSIKLLLCYSFLVIIPIYLATLNFISIKYLVYILLILIISIIVIDRFNSKSDTDKKQLLDFEVLGVIELLEISSIEEYFRVKSKFLDLNKEYSEKNKKVEELEHENNRFMSEIKNLRKQITLKIEKAGIRCAENNFSKDNPLDGIRQYNELFDSYRALLADENLRCERIIYLESLISETLSDYKSSFCVEVKNIEDIEKHISENIEESSKLRNNIKNEIADLVSEETTVTSLINELAFKIQKNEDLEELNIRLNIKFADLENRLNELVKFLNECDILEKTINEIDEKINDLDKKMIDLEEEKKELEGYAISLNIAMEKIYESNFELKKDILPQICERTSVILKQLTSEKYQEIRIDKENKIMIKNTISDTVLESDYFSGGTIDQIFLALRIAISDVLSEENEELPLLFDEVFVHSDDYRTLSTLKYLVELSKQRQIVLFTCKKREIEILESISSSYNLINL